MIGKSRKIAQVLVVVSMMLKKGQTENDQRLLTWQIIGMVAFTHQDRKEEGASERERMSFIISFTDESEYLASRIGHAQPGKGQSK